MQSLLTYRRFGRQVKAQFDRDQQKAEALNRINASLPGEEQEHQLEHRSSSIDSLPASPPDEQMPDTVDVEKAERLTEDITGEGYEEAAEEVELDGNLATIVTRGTTRTQDSYGTRLGNVMTGIEVRTLTREMTRTRSRKAGGGRASRTENEKSEEREKVFVVSYETERDMMNPHNWSYVTRIGATILIAAIGFIVGFASSIDSAALPQAADDFGVSQVAESLATGIFLIGFGFGALLAGPISETVGRNPVYIVTLAIYSIWILASGLAPNFAAQLIFRFLAGFFGSTPLTCAGGSISDLWSPMERVFAFPVFANAAFMGPIFGPVVGGYVAQSSLVSWRWTEWITLIISGLVLVLVVFFQPETYAPILLKWKAHHLRQLTGDDRYVAEVEIRADNFQTRLRRALYRPFLLAVREPIVMLFALYLTVIYIVLFTFLDGYNYIFGDTYGFSQGSTGLAFLGIAIGLCFASLWVPLIYHWAKREVAALEDEGKPGRLAPEQRLWFAMFGAPAVPISLFWMGWTTYPHISYWSPLVASVVFGYGILCIFISTYQYIIDSYEIYAASALASLTLIRYVAAGGMVVVGIPFYENLGVHWTLTVLGAISLVMVPVPYAFYKWGPKIRAMSHYAADQE